MSESPLNDEPGKGQELARRGARQRPKVYTPQGPVTAAGLLAAGPGQGQELIRRGARQKVIDGILQADPDRYVDALLYLWGAWG